MFGLSHGYDLVMLILVVPYIFWLYDRGYRRDWIFLLALIAVASIPRSFATRINPGMLIGGARLTSRLCRPHPRRSTSSSAVNPPKHTPPCRLIIDASPPGGSRRKELLVSAPRQSEIHSHSVCSSDREYS